MRRVDLTEKNFNQTSRESSMTACVFMLVYVKHLRLRVGAVTDLPQACNAASLDFNTVQ